MLTPQNLLDLAGGGTLPATAADWPRASGVNFHTGRLQPGDIFFALAGANAHGINHADTALERGASFVISDRPHPRGLQVPDPAGLLLKLGSAARDKLEGPVIGITGSAGKTTTKDLLAALTDGAATPGNLNTPLALACTLVSAAVSNPQRSLVLELGIDHPGEMSGLLDLTRPDIGILTTIAPSHLDGLGDLATVAAEKRQLLDRAARAYVSVQAAGQLTELPAGAKTYGLDPAADIAAAVRDGQLWLAGRTWPLAVPGSGYASNLTGAIGVALDLGVPEATLLERLAAAHITPGRLQLRRAAGRLLIDDTYNSNPASAAVALEVLAGQPGPRVAILGDMRELGADSARYHRELGEATRGFDIVVAVGGHAADVRAGNPSAIIAADTAQALPLLAGLPNPATVLLKASRSLGFERLVKALEANS